MASPILLLAIVLFALVFGGIGYLLGSLSTDKAPVDVAALAERDAFIEHLREVAWQHRDIAPELSTIIIDEVNTRHRRL